MDEIMDLQGDEWADKEGTNKFISFGRKYSQNGALLLDRLSALSYANYSVKTG